MADIPELVKYIAQGLAEHPDEVEVSEFTKGRLQYVRLRVASDDMGRVIGREGRVANAIRVIIKAAADEESWNLEIAD
jgi:predicted RNA-binding protein YlqC (UPF0109 family)